MSVKAFVRLGLMGAALLAVRIIVPGTPSAHFDAASATITAASHEDTPAPALCDGAIQHPIDVKVTALDPVEPGATVRVEVATSAREALESGEIALVSTGGAALLSEPAVPLGRLAAGKQAQAAFTVRLPDDGARTLLQFRVTGEGANGLSSRGATFNLLPNGPADPGRIVTTDSGESVAEYRARRIQ